MDDFERVKTAKEEVTTDVVEPAREPELEVELEDVWSTLLLLNSHKGENVSRIFVRT